MHTAHNLKFTNNLEMHTSIVRLLTSNNNHKNVVIGKLSCSDDEYIYWLRSINTQTIIIIIIQNMKMQKVYTKNSIKYHKTGSICRKRLQWTIIIMFSDKFTAHTSMFSSCEIQKMRRNSESLFSKNKKF